MYRATAACHSDKYGISRKSTRPICEFNRIVDECPSHSLRNGYRPPVQRYGQCIQVPRATCKCVGQLLTLGRAKVPHDKIKPLFRPKRLSSAG